MLRVREFKSISSELWIIPVRATLNAILLAAVLASLSCGATIFDTGLTAIAPTDPVQLGRLGRDNVPSDWSTPKAFPGILNPTVPYRYDTFALPNIAYPYIQITIDDVSGMAQTFASAYLNVYTPGGTAPNIGLDVNYLGDAGNSGNFFGDDPRAFQVVVPPGATLAIVVNDASPSAAGIGQPFRVLVEGFVDTSFSDAPEPATCGFVVMALGAGAFVVRKRKSLQ
ncbi:MAG: hypothetical protein ACJ74Y_12835 [Bryobacteraceae bacterium]